MSFNYSVLMSVYYKDNPKWLKESIDSVLNQTIKTNDFVIVKDGKLNKELDLVISEYFKEYSDIFNIVELKENVGLGPALAFGVEKCKNEWIARTDADDICDEKRIEEEIKIIITQEVDMIGCNAIEFVDNVCNAKAIRILPEKHEDIIKYAKKRNPLCHPTMLLRKSKVIEAGNYRSYYLCEDYDLCIRMFESGAKAYNVQKELMYVRVSDEFYGRRGGIRYLQSMLKFKTEQFKNGFFSLKDYIITSSASIVICLLPNWCRSLVYTKILRKKVKNRKNIAGGV